MQSEPHLLAAYTCTPLVKFPIAQLKPNEKVRGTTIAELGSGNRPLDMIVYEKDGEDFVLLSNSRRGMMKIPMAKADEVIAVTDRVTTETAGLGAARFTVSKRPRATIAATSELLLRISPPSALLITWTSTLIPCDSSREPTTVYVGSSYGIKH